MSITVAVIVAGSIGYVLGRRRRRSDRLDSAGQFLLAYTLGRFVR